MSFILLVGYYREVSKLLSSYKEGFLNLLIIQIEKTRVEWQQIYRAYTLVLWYNKPLGSWTHPKTVKVNIEAINEETRNLVVR